ncbi:tripartite tricarboxylate transporter substrate binding protein [Pantoea sp. 18069]|uniref:Bug family tripartite tricarboxylate transporter substrate binding protein n=1 Tax=Pantoea sp. 18069 TaxID=2681415 RepID=UPI001358EB96|nr:tripartite tricarboxylate transporter substrate binding protein [Pantoea sp. 18069]
MRLLLQALCVVVLGSTGAAQAQDFPARPITIVVPVPPGGIVDMAARLASEPLTRALGQPVVIDNRAGASGNIAYGMVAAAKPDGYTLLASYSMYHVGNPSMFSGLRWSAASFKPIGMVAVSPSVVVVHPDLPVHNLKELAAYAKAHPGKVNYASQGSGSVPHIGTELFKQMAGVDMVHVPYKGSGPAIQDVLSGRVQLFVATPPSVLGHIKAGKLRAIAVASDARVPLLPDVSTSAEQGFADFRLDAWVALFAPAGTPDAVVARLSTALATNLNTPEVRERAAQAGVVARSMTSAELGSEVAADTAYWSAVIRKADIKVD